MVILDLSISELLEGYATGAFTPKDVLEEYIQVISAKDNAINAFVSLDLQGARREAAEGCSGPLAGIPFAAKDVLNTACLPTEMGSRIYAGYHARFDAGSVALAKQAGSILIGKTTTAEFAGTHPPLTKNPHNPAHTPGGSSSGSAAAVAANMCTFALGTQTGGSILRPAAFCGVVGFKPTYGAYPISGMLSAAHSFDTVGIFTRAASDAREVHNAIMRQNNKKKPDIDSAAIGVWKGHLNANLSSEVDSAIDKVKHILAQYGHSVFSLDLPKEFGMLSQHRRIINDFERYGNLAGEMSQLKYFRELSKKVYKRGAIIDGESYFKALRALEACRKNVESVFGGCDFIVTAVTSGEAPLGLDSTGDPMMQELWTTLQLPTISVPCGVGRHGLPIGIQLIGHKFFDSELLELADRIQATRLI